MQNKCKKFRLWSILLLVMLMAAGFTCHSTSRDVQAATKNGFRTVKGKTYYYKNGKKVKGWLTLNGKKYYFSKSTGVQAKGWVKDKKGRKRYFTSKAGVMVTGWLSNSKRQRRYFAPSTGYMKTKWLKLGGKTYYLYAKSGVAATGFVKDSKGNIRYFSKTGIMATGWLTSSSGVKRYFASTSSTSTNGIMAVGFKTINNVTYYFYSGSGAMATGWVENTDKGTKYYFDPTTGAMYTGTQTIDGVTYVFSDTGVCQGEKQNDPTPDGNTGSKTIKNYLAGALMPVGKALYVWGGGWNDSTRKGLSDTMTNWYNKWSANPSGYDYNNYRDLSTSNRAKGFDCSGFVGWSAYQVMQTQSGVGYGYTVVSGEIGSYYKGKGWGTIVNQSYLSQNGWELKPGDIGYNDGHTWIVLGQCSDKSGLEQLEIFKSFGVDLSRVVLSHIDLSADLDYMKRLLDQGVNIAFDTIGKCNYQPDVSRADWLSRLCAEGYDTQIVMSMDITRRSNFADRGGVGYSYLLDTFAPLASEAGVPDRAWENLLYRNALRIYKGQK